MNKENSGHLGFDLEAALTCSRAGVPDKDAVQKQLEQIREGYRELGVAGRDSRRAVEGLRDGFDNADSAGQVVFGSRIAELDRNVSDAARLRVRS